MKLDFLNGAVSGWMFVAVIVLLFVLIIMVANVISKEKFNNLGIYNGLQGESQRDDTGSAAVTSLSGRIKEASVPTMENLIGSRDYPVFWDNTPYDLDMSRSQGVMNSSYNAVPATVAAAASRAATAAGASPASPAAAATGAANAASAAGASPSAATAAGQAAAGASESFLGKKSEAFSDAELVLRAQGLSSPTMSHL